MKKLISVILSLAVALPVLSGCGKSDPVNKAEKLSVVTTIFPEYDWVREIVKGNDNVEITMLLDKGVDLHSFQPAAEDIVKLASCDMFIYVGGESDAWVEDALAEATNKDMVVVNLLDVLGDSVKEEEVVEGMEAEHEHDHGKEVSTFEDNEAQDRSLADWAGEWQSGYPLVLDGSLDEAFEHKAENGDKTAEQYKEMYQKGYETEYDFIKIEGNHITFTDNNGNVTEADYNYEGIYIQNWSGGTKAAMYRFISANPDSGAPVYIEFNDHMIEPQKAEHFHIRMSNTGFDDIEDPENRFPTFYPAELSPEEVCEELAGHGHGEEEEEYDEHVWLSLKNAEVLCQYISDELVKLDANNKSLYEENTKKYIASLDALDKRYAGAVSGAATKTVLFGDRFPFRYMVDDYGLGYFAAFAGCSAESEASFETITFLAEKTDELGLKSILQIESADGKIAETIKNNTAGKDQEILTMDSMQSVTAEDVSKGATYLGIMENNLEVLKQALK